MWNKMFCSLAAQLVSLACLIGIARCLEAFLCASYVTDVIWFLWMIVLWRGVALYLQSVKYRGTQQSAANLPPLPHFTVHFPQRRPPGSVSHSTPDVNSPPDLGSIQNNYAQFHRQMARADRSDCESLLFFFWFAFRVPGWLTCSCSWSLGSIVISRHSAWLTGRVLHTDKWAL